MENSDNKKIPQRLMSFDFGKKRIGVAFGQTVTQTTKPLTTLSAKDGVPNWDEISALIKKWHPEEIVVGIPLNMDGSDQDITHDARVFAQTLSQKFNLPVHEMDERLTTKAAREQIFNEGGYKALQGGHVDQVAAQLILENWFALNCTNR